MSRIKIQNYEKNLSIKNQPHVTMSHESANQNMSCSGLPENKVQYIMTVHLQGSDSELTKLISIFLLGGEHKLSVSFTKVNIVNLFLTPRILCIIDDHFILSRISILGQMKSD